MRGADAGRRAAQARSILDLDVKTQPVQLLDWGDYVIDERGDASLQAVLAKPGLFRPTLPQSSYSLRPGQSLWIRFTVAKALQIRERAASVFWFACALAALDAGGAFLAGALASPLRLWLTLTLVVTTTFVCIGLAMWSWRHGDHFALKLLLAMAPMVLVLPLQLEAVIPWLGPSVRQQSLPIVLLALAFTVCASYLLLALRSQEMRDHRRRIAQLHEIDPATGLVNDTVFARRMRETIERDGGADGCAAGGERGNGCRANSGRAVIDHRKRYGFPGDECEGGSGLLRTYHVSRAIRWHHALAHRQCTA